MVNTINAEQASEVISQIEPSYVIPMHFKTKSHSATYEKLGTLQDFLKRIWKRRKYNFSRKINNYKNKVAKNTIGFVKTCI